MCQTIEIASLVKSKQREYWDFQPYPSLAEAYQQIGRRWRVSYSFSDQPNRYEGESL